MQRNNRPNLNNLSEDVLLHVLSFLDHKEKIQVEKTKKINDTTKEKMWKESLRTEHKVTQMDALKQNYPNAATSKKPFKRMFFREQETLVAIRQNHGIKSNEKVIELRNQLRHCSFFQTNLHLELEAMEKRDKQLEYLETHGPAIFRMEKSRKKNQNQCCVVM